VSLGNGEKEIKKKEPAASRIQEIKALKDKQGILSSTLLTRFVLLCLFCPVLSLL